MKNPTTTPSPFRKGRLSLYASSLFAFILLSTNPADGADQREWTIQASGTANSFSGQNSLALYNSTFILSITSQHEVLHYDGTAWKPLPGASEAYSSHEDWGWPRGGVAIASPEKIFIANRGDADTSGTRRLFLAEGSNDSRSWTTNLRPTGSNTRLISVWAQRSGNNVLVGTPDQLYLSENGGSGAWIAVADKDNAGITAHQIRSAADDSVVFALDHTNQKLNYSLDQGTTFTHQAETPGGINAFSALSATSLWAVGGAGAIWHWDGESFISQTSPTTQDLYGIHAFGTNNVWAVGDNNTLLHYNGDIWTQHPLSLDLPYTLYNIAGDELGNLHITGSNGLILYGAAIPEPRGTALIGIGIVALAINTFRRRKS